MASTEELHRLLHQRSEQLKFLSEFSSDWYWEQDAELRFTIISRNAAAQGRFPVEQSLGKTRWELPYEGMTEELWQEHKEVLYARQPFRDFVLKRRDGEGRLRYTALSGAPIYDAEGNFSGYRGIGRDITESMRAKQREEMEHAVARLLTEYSEPAEVMPKIVQAICQILEWDYGACWSVALSNENEVSRLAYSWCRPSLEAQDFFDSFKDDISFCLNRSSQAKPGGLLRRVLLSHEPVWIPDVTSDPTFMRAAAARKAGLHTALAFPALVDRRIFAMVELYSRDTRQSDPSLLHSICSIGRMIGLQFQRKQLEKHQAMGHAVTRLLAEDGEPDTVMPKVLQLLCEDMGWEYGTYWAIDKQQRLICAARWHSASLEGTPFLAYVDQTTGATTDTSGSGAALPVHQAWNSKQPVWLDNRDGSEEWSYSELAAQAGLRTGACFPVMNGAEAAGVLEFLHRSVRPADKGIISTLHTLGAQIGQFYQRKHAEEQIRYLAYYDGLTGLPNRTLFSERLTHALANARRNARKLAVLFIDLDRFKIVNDTMGHEAGDKLLQQAAQRFSNCLRESDTVARLGGDEFVILLEDILDADDAIMVAQKINHSLALPFLISESRFHVTSSIGISIFPDAGYDGPALMKNADIAMYQAKALGKNNCQVYSEYVNADSIRKLSMEADLRTALERGEFCLHYQAKVDTISGHITGVEALLRWNHPEHGMIPPSEFIPIAEETGLIIPIGRWVMRAACRQNKAWQDQGLRPVPVSINISPRQFRDDNLIADITEALSASGLPPALLDIEITESMFIHDPKKVTSILQQLRNMGSSVSIDDFGTGYSSLSQLKGFPINTIKIDRSFINDLMQSAKDQSITEAIIALGKALKLNIVAEGVESGQQLEFLRTHRCSEIQGYYFSKPLPDAEFAELLKGDPDFNRLAGH